MTSARSAVSVGADVEVSGETLREVPTKKLRYASCLLEEVG